MMKKRAIRPTVEDGDAVMKRRRVAEQFRLPRSEFARRQRYRDADNNVLAPARADDALYRSLQQHDRIDALDDGDGDGGRGLPKQKRAVTVRDTDGTSGTLYGRAMFYVALRAKKWPAGDIEFTDPSDDTLYTATVRSAMFDGRSKGGYVLLDNVVGWGRMANPREFRVRK